jgi:hypothetical protein
MTLALRRTVFHDGERRPDDYEVRYNGRTVGRILRLTEHRPGAVALDADRPARADLRPEWWRDGYFRGRQGCVPP